MASRKRNDISVDAKNKLLLQYDELPKMSQREAAKKLGIAQSSLNDLLKWRATSDFSNDTNLSGRKRKRQSKYEAVDEALFMWFRQAGALHAPINRGILMDKANELAGKLGMDFTASDGWLSRWKERHGIVYKKLHGEKKDADTNAAAGWIETVWPTILSKYAHEDIFNLDETGLYYRATPDYCMVFKNAPESGGKKMKERITVLLICNMTGTTKMKPLVIGKSRNPTCFKGVRNLPVDYCNNSNAWMTSTIYEDYLRKWDSKLNRKIVVILDNCPAHPKLTLKNIELVFLPANTTSIIQPLDQGIIKSFKTLYRSSMRRKIINAIDDGKGTSGDIVKKLTILDAIHMTHAAWTSVSTSCIVNCFKKSGMGVPTEDQSPSDPTDPTIIPDGMSAQVFNEWVDIDNNLPTSHTMDEDEIAQSIVESRTNQDKTLEDESDEEDQQEKRMPTTRRDILHAVAILRQATEEHKIDEEFFCFLNRFESVLMNALPRIQTHITDFFV